MIVAMGWYDCIDARVPCPSCGILHLLHTQIQFLLPEITARNGTVLLGERFDVAFDPNEFDTESTWDYEWKRMRPSRQNGRVSFLADRDSHFCCLCGATCVLVFEFSFGRTSNSQGWVVLEEVRVRALHSLATLSVDFANVPLPTVLEEDPSVPFDDGSCVDEDDRARLLCRVLQERLSLSWYEEHCVRAPTRCLHCKKERLLSVPVHLLRPLPEARFVGRVSLLDSSESVSVVVPGTTITLAPCVLTRTETRNYVLLRKQQVEHELMFADWLPWYRCDCVAASDLFLHRYRRIDNKATLLDCGLASSRESLVVDWFDGTFVEQMGLWPEDENEKRAAIMVQGQREWERFQRRFPG